MRSPMQGPTKKSIMQSKLLVNVQEDGSPCITVIQPKESSEFILAEKVLSQFFERLQHESPFLGVLNEGLDDPANKVRNIIPLTIPHAMQWLERFFADRYEKSKNGIYSPEYIEEKRKQIQEAFGILNDLYYGKPE